MKQTSKIVREWRDKGYFVINLVRVAPIGLPDYICLKPDHVVFVESKETWDKMSPLQNYTMQKLKNMGFECYKNGEKIE